MFVQDNRPQARCRKHDGSCLVFQHSCPGQNYVDNGYQSTPVLPGQETGRGKKNGGGKKGMVLVFI